MVRRVMKSVIKQLLKGPGRNNKYTCQSNDEPGKTECRMAFEFQNEFNGAFDMIDAHRLKFKPYAGLRDSFAASKSVCNELMSLYKHTTYFYVYQLHL